MYETMFKLYIVESNERESNDELSVITDTLNEKTDFVFVLSQYCLPGWDVSAFNLSTEEIIAEVMEATKNYPDKVFQIEACGDAADDMWIAYLKGDRYQLCRAIIEYENDGCYDPALLVECEMGS